MFPKGLANNVRSLSQSWTQTLEPEFEADYMRKLQGFLATEKNLNKIVYPPESDWFRALELTSFEDVKVVILGQDPYHGEGQAHGLAFSVPHDVKIPPSLFNIYKELKADLDISPPPNGNLEHWAKQGVLLLNAVLTVEAGKAGSHQGHGWEKFTDAIIRKLDNQQRPLVFILWGKYAQDKAGYIDRKRHLVLASAHPSPLSAHTGFFGSKPFSQTNTFLRSKGLAEIDWS